MRLPATSVAKASNHPAARVLATLAMCMFSGLIFWVFRRPKRRQNSSPRGSPKRAVGSSSPSSLGASTPTCSVRELELHSSVQRLLGELSKARTQADHQQAELQAMEDQIEARSAECAKLQKCLEQRTHEVGILQEDCGKLKDQRRDITAELTAVTGDNQKLQEEMQKLHAEVKALQHQLAARQTLQITNEHLENQIKELGIQLEGALLTKLKTERECERAIAESRAEAERHYQAGRRAVAEYEKIRDKSAEALRKMGILQAEMGRINTELEVAKRERAELIGQHGAEREARRQLEGALAAERARSRALEVENRNAQEIICNMDARIRALEHRASQ